MKKLLFSVTKKDLNVQTFRSGKGGGQRRDKVSTAVRIVHKDSGAVGYSQDQRSLEQNKKTAFNRMFNDPKFTIWWKRKVNETFEKERYEFELYNIVNQLMDDTNIKTEIYKDGQWTSLT